MNHEIAQSLREIADLLQQQQANYFRVGAYRRAANTVESSPRSMKLIVDTKGISGLTALPGIGEGIARSIYEYVATGKMTRLETLRGKHDPVHLFQQIPGVGPALAAKIYNELHVDTLEALETAAHNGRLQALDGIGEGRVESIKLWLANTLGKRIRRYPGGTQPAQPTVALLLEVDRRYREGAARDELPKIAPKRFNPNATAWLPVLHTTRHGWHFTALYSNTPRAHELGRTRDWVVVYFYDEHHHEGQNTVVDEMRGNLIGKRVVRGREAECRQFYSH